MMKLDSSLKDVKRTGVYQQLYRKSRCHRNPGLRYWRPVIINAAMDTQTQKKRLNQEQVEQRAPHLRIEAFVLLL